MAAAGIKEWESINKYWVRIERAVRKLVIQCASEDIPGCGSVAAHGQ